MCFRREIRKFEKRKNEIFLFNSEKSIFHSTVCQNILAQSSSLRPPPPIINFSVIYFFSFYRSTKGNFKSIALTHITLTARERERGSDHYTFFLIVYLIHWHRLTFTFNNHMIISLFSQLWQDGTSELCICREEEREGDEWERLKKYCYLHFSSSRMSSCTSPLQWRWNYSRNISIGSCSNASLMPAKAKSLPLFVFQIHNNPRKVYVFFIQ